MEEKYKLIILSIYRVNYGLQIVEGDFSSIQSSSRYCSINPNRTGNFSLLSLQTVSAKEAQLPVPVRPFPHKTRSLYLLLAQTVSAKQGPLPGQVALCRHRTVTLNHVLVNPESFMETSWSAGALIRPSQREASITGLEKNTLSVCLYVCMSVCLQSKFE